jgi:hypothetical protein
MPRPSYLEHPPARAAFERELAMPRPSLEAATRAAIAAGGYVSVEDLAKHTRVTNDVERLLASRQMDAAWSLRHEEGQRFDDEARAIAVSKAFRSWAETTGTEDDDRRRAEAAEQARLRMREEFAQREGAKAFDAWLAARREQHIEEARCRYDELHPSRLTTSTPEPPLDVQARAANVAMDVLLHSDATTNPRKRNGRPKA